MAVEDSVAQDQLRAFIERIERMEEEKAAIAADIKEIYAEAKGNGFDTKILRKIVTIRKQDANERMEQEALLELYMGALGMVAAPPEDYDREDRGPNLSGIDPELLATLIEGSKTEVGRKIIMGAIDQVKAGGRVGALRADPSISIVSASQIKKSEPQPSQPAGSDLTTPHAPEGQAAPIPTAVESPGATQVADVGVGGEANQPKIAPVAQPQRTTTENSTVGNGVTGGESAAQVSGTDKSAEASVSAAPASKYAAPGVVTWESTPPEGVIRHDYSMAFGELGQDIAVIEDDLVRANAEPIVKVGPVILDGWARYMKARSITPPDGQPFEYPVVQYDGVDALMDCIRWNVAGRILNDAQKRLIAQRLSRAEPRRKAEIYAAFELGMELVGA